MVEIFWITNENLYGTLAKVLEKGTRESIKTLSYDKLEKFKDDLPAFSILCFEVDQNFGDFFSKHELSFQDQLIVPVCANENILNLVKISSELKNPNRFQLVLNPEDNEEVSSNNFRTILKLSSLSRSAQEFTQVGKNLNKLVTSTLGEVDRLRRLHERLVTLRSESIKGIKVTSKFASGESAGGEFFDMIVGEGQMLILLSHTKSYMSTSVLLSHLDLLRELKTFSTKDIAAFLKAVIKDLNDDQSLELMFMIIDNKNLDLKAYSFGNTHVLSKDRFIINGNDYDVSENGLKEVEHNLKLERNSTYYILSPGLIKMTSGIVDNIPLIDFFKSQSNKTGTEVLNELFFNLKKHSNSMFLKRDASALVIEVGSNVIVEV